MLDLITVQDFKLYRGITSNEDDARIQQSITRASAYLQSEENGAGYLFRVDEVTTRRFDGYSDVGNRESNDRSLPPYRPDSAYYDNGYGYGLGYGDGYGYGRRTQRRDRKRTTHRTLFFDKMCAEVVEVRQNGEAIPSSDYYTNPVNDAPFYAIVLTRDSSEHWDSHEELSVEVDGYWGYSREPDETVKGICYELTSFIYDAAKGSAQAASASLQNTIITPEGFVIRPSALPMRVQKFIQSYQLKVS